jgi:hypothetical protein
MRSSVHLCSIRLLLMNRRGMQEPARKIEEADKLVRQTLMILSRGCPPDQVGQAARDKLLDMRPQLQEALESLADIEGHRNLTEEENARRHAFQMLLNAILTL